MTTHSRMKLWRSERRFKQCGIQHQLSVWCPKEEYAVTRQLLAIICEPSNQGLALRLRLAKELLALDPQPIPALPIPGHAHNFEYQDRSGHNSTCSIVMRTTNLRTQLAFLQTSSSRIAEVFPSAATLARQRLLSHVAPLDIDWFDVIPSNGITVLDTAIYRVSMSCLNGIYHDPQWTEADNHNDLIWISSLFKSQLNHFPNIAPGASPLQ